MIIIKIIGGLGNQMFLYAYAKSLEQKGYKVKIDISAFEIYKLHGGYQLDKYNIDLAVSSKVENENFYKNNFFFKVLRRIGFYKPNILKEKNLLFDSKFLELEDENYIEGYFQSEKYFKSIRTILLEQFTVGQELSSYAVKIKNKILNTHNSCSVHIRRGDFTNQQNINIHGVCELEYYQKSIQYLQEIYENLEFFIFSDDIAWVKDNLSLESAIYVKSTRGMIPHEDMYLMSLCQHNIIANSSFSWWGAWLNRYENKIVIAPKRWFADDDLEQQSQDIVCDGWIKI